MWILQTCACLPMLPMVVFACGDAVPVFAQNADKPYNVDLMSVLKAFAGKGALHRRLKQSRLSEVP